MISKIMKELQNRKKDNRGAALVMVIIAIAFVGMLVAMILYMAYCNYLMKANDVKAKDNFYSAEYVMDVINAGLQLDISECISEAYVKTVGNSSGTEDADILEVEFQKDFIKRIEKKLQAKDETTGAVIAGKWNVKHLKSFLTQNKLTVVDTAGEKGVYFGLDGDNKMETAHNQQYITLYNLKIVYTDDNGYVSIIRTDIRIKVPEIGFAKAVAKMDVENYAIIANQSLINDSFQNSEGSNGNTSIVGNVFGGYKGVSVGNDAGINFVKETVQPGDDMVRRYKLIADSLNVEDTEKGISIDPEYTTYVDNINVTSSTFVMRGDSFVGDDLSIGGKSSDITIEGAYKGYGNMLGDADGSSSILINGGNTSIDFGNLKSLMLSGHAYVGAQKYDADVDRLAYASSADADTLVSDKIDDEEDYFDKLNDENSTFQETAKTVPKNSMDFMMGESISVKANQLLYMVPSECVGYKVSTGEQVVAKNPMTYSEYEMLMEQEEKTDANGNVEMVNIYDIVRLDKLWTKLGCVPYTNDYKAVFRRVNGTVLVYLYLDFGTNETLANEFFKTYYEYDKEGINRYVSSYINEMVWNTDLQSNMTLAGNAFYINRNGEVVFVENDLNDEVKYGNMTTLQSDYSAMYDALMHTLKTDTAAVAGGQPEMVFDYLVDSDKLAAMNGKTFVTGAGDAEVSARIIDGNVMLSDLPESTRSSTRLIVASGDIYLDDDYKGLAIAGGNIYICTDCSSVTYSPAEVIQAMRAKYENSVTGDVMYAYEVFGANGALSYENGSSEESDDETLELTDLIVYQNWKKE